jgi:pimeloyl-ACP methyl ester carboxylesterase
MAIRLAIGAALLTAGYFGWILLWIAISHARFRAFHRRAGTRCPALGPRGWVRFYRRTVASILRLTAWWALAPSGRPLPALAPGAAVEVGEIVLCVHGFHTDGSCLWGLRRCLARRGRVSFAVDLGLPYRRAEVYAAALRRDLGALVAAFPAARIDVVAHSMGGLMLRHALGEAPALAPRLRRVVTLGTPHHGTALLGWFRHGPVYRTMGRDSEYLRGLPVLAALAPGAEVTTIASAHDLLVYPVECAHLEGARQVTLEGIGHLGLLTDRAIQERVADLLDGGAPDSARGAGEAEDRAAEQQRAQESERQ